MKTRNVLVVLATLASTAASAQSGTAASPPSKPTLTWYGIADVNFAAQNSGAGPFVSANSGGMWGSRFGLKGEAALSDNFTAVYLAEAGMQFDTAVVGNPNQPGGINASTGSTGGGLGTGSQFFARQMFAGVRSTYGTLTLGRQYSGNYLIAAALALPFPGAFGNSSSMTPLNGMPTRVNNSANYVSPSIGGARVQIDGYSGLENNTEGNVASGTSFTNAKAGRGGDASVSYSGFGFSGAAGGWYLYNNTFATGESELAVKKGYQVGVAYDIGVRSAKVKFPTGAPDVRSTDFGVSLFGLFTQAKISGGNYENVTKTLSKSTAWAVGALVPYRGNRLALSYTKLDDQSALNKDAELLGVLYWYEIRPTTQVYAAFGYLLNHGNSAYNLTDAGSVVASPVRPGAEARGLQMGISQFF